MQTCAVIPAAGKGSRLGLKGPKILASITDDQTVWSLLRAKLLNTVDHIHLVVSPDAWSKIHALTREDEKKNLVSLSIQPKPIGMGDAIFRGFSQWMKAQTILVIWGDQVFVSENTLKKAIELHGHERHRVVIPLVRMKNPYVEYVFEDDKLKKVRQSREGDLCFDNGLADMGTFALSVSDLIIAWKKYLKIATTGNKTNEINFLPFLPFLSNELWDMKTFIVDDVREARGINTVEDLEFFQKLYSISDQ